MSAGVAQFARLASAYHARSGISAWGRLVQNAFSGPIAMMRMSHANMIPNWEHTAVGAPSYREPTVR